MTTPNKHQFFEKALAVFANEKASKEDLSEAIRDLTNELNARKEALESEIEEAEEEAERKEHEQEIEDARQEGREESREEVQDETLDWLARYGGHQDCLEGAVVGQKLHPRCTCGWNDVATDLERR